MEIPKYWREMPTNVSFEGNKKSWKDSNLETFKFPGGEIPLMGSFDQIKERFARRGFNEKEMGEILYGLFGAISSESAISGRELQDSLLELFGSEVGK